MTLAGPGAQLSRPSRIKRGIAFSQVAVITDTAEHFVGDDEGEGAYRRQHPCLVFRMANLRPSAVCDSSFTLLFFRHDASPRAQGAEDYVMQVGPDCPSHPLLIFTPHSQLRRRPAGAEL
jgi:hypothetical protein